MIKTSSASPSLFPKTRNAMAGRHVERPQRAVEESVEHAALAAQRKRQRCADAFEDEESEASDRWRRPAWADQNGIVALCKEALRQLSPNMKAAHIDNAAMDADVAVKYFVQDMSNGCRRAAVVYGTRLRFAGPWCSGHTTSSDAVSVRVKDFVIGALWACDGDASLSSPQSWADSNEYVQRLRRNRRLVHRGKDLLGLAQDATIALAFQPYTEMVYVCRL